MVRLRSRKHLIGALTALMAVLLLLWSAGAAQAEGETIRVVSSSVTSEFPDGIRFKLEASGDNEISSVAVRFRIGRRTTGSYDFLEFETGRLADSELFWRTNTAARYIPPGTIITYNFEIEDSEGTRLITEQEQFIYYDIRFQWEEVSRGAIAVAYHGPVKTRADKILVAITDTLSTIGPLLGADIEEPIRVTMYNNVKEMLEALPPGSTTIRRELITEGQAFAEVGMLLVLGGGRLALGTASHEVTHILVHRGGDSVTGDVPPWLNEGLAEFGNVDPSFSYDIALEFAMATDRLLPLTSSRGLPSSPEDVIIFYGQARSIVRFMVGVYGPAKMRQLMATMKTGKRIGDAILEVYGISALRLENQWRERIGASKYTPPDTTSARPTPISRPAFLPYSLTPQPRSATVGSAISTPTPSPEPKGVDTPTPTPQAVARAQGPAQDSTTPEAGDSARLEDESNEGGGACSAPRHGGLRPMDISGVVLLFGLMWLGLRRRLRL